MPGEIIYNLLYLPWFYFGGTCLIHFSSLQLVFTHRNDQNPEAEE